MHLVRRFVPSEVILYLIFLSAIRREMRHHSIGFDPKQSQLRRPRSHCGIEGKEKIVQNLVLFFFSFRT